MPARSATPDGSAFGRARPAVAAEGSCPCGLGLYAACCGPILAGEPASTAEALMRSRFTAFALSDHRHLERTWYPSTRPERLDLDPALRWVSLSVNESVGGTPGERRGTVDFRARWQHTSTGERGELRERSRFVFQRERWWYLDGVVASQ